MNIQNPFKQYKDRHLGSTAILYGSGPTILDFESDKVPSEVIKYGVNDQIFLDLNLDYWFMGDAMPQNPEKFYDRYDDYNEYQPKIQKFIRYCNWHLDRQTSIPNWGTVPRNGQLPLEMNNSLYYMCDLGGNPNECLFKKDVSEGSLIGVASITFEVLQFMLFCGIKKIYLVGHDCNYNNGTFAGYMIGKSQGAGPSILRYWKIVKPWIELNYPDVEIYSINPVSLDIFEEARVQDIKFFKET